MATITIDNLSVTGSELFCDSESYLDQLSESDTLSIQGGFKTYPLPTPPVFYTTLTTGPQPTPPVFLP